DARAGVSSTEDGGINYDGALALNIPLTKDTAALRVSAFYNHDAGYIDNVQLGRDDVNQANVSGGRADFLLRPTPDLSIRLTAFTQRVERDGTSYADYSLATGEPIDGDLSQRRIHPEPFTQTFNLFSGTISKDLGWGQLTSVSAYQESNTSYTYDVSAQF